MADLEITHWHMFHGAGGGALGFNRGEARVGSVAARFTCLGGVDSDPACVRDFSRLVGVPGTCLDLFDREQYEAFHGAPPPPSWRQARREDLHRSAQGRRPDIVFLSAPCKGFSGLLSGAAAASAKYQALNQLALRGLLLLLDAWGDDPPPLILFENVPRIAQRGRALLDQITGLLRGHGYAVAETAHDCGEIGGLAQHRRRFLLVARHQAKVPAFLYEPPKRKVRAIGEVLGELLMPEHPAAGPMHRLPRLKWETWVRLALIPAGGDWRDLPDMQARDAVARKRWERDGQKTAGEVHLFKGKHGVTGWDDPARTVTGGSNGDNVADPRWGGGRLGVVRWDREAGTVTGEAYPSNGPFAVGDPRWRSDVMGVRPWDQPSGTVTGRAQQSTGAFSVADPRAGAGHYGVLPWDQPSGAVTASGCADNGRGNVADPRAVAWMPPQDVPLIISLDGTWHRPLTTYELAALQGFPVGPDFELDGSAHSRWREAIGNAVPPPAAQAIAGVMGQVLLLAATGQTFALSSTPIWVRELAIALGVDHWLKAQAETGQGLFAGVTNG